MGCDELKVYIEPKEDIRSLEKDMEYTNSGHKIKQKDIQLIQKQAKKKRKRKRKHRTDEVRQECVHAKSLQSCSTLCNPMYYSPPGSLIHRTLQHGRGQTLQALIKISNLVQQH